MASQRASADHAAPGKLTLTRRWQVGVEHDQMRRPADAASLVGQEATDGRPGPALVHDEWPVSR
jgi:hypothetical protein